MPDADQLKAYLAERDVLCPGCGYNLRGLVGSACPECQETIELRVGLVEPKLGAIIAVLAGLWATLGTAVALLASMAVVSIVFGDLAPLAWWVPHSTALVMAGPAAAVFTARRGRRWLRARSRVVRRLVIAFAWLAFVASTAVWLAVVMMS